MVDDEWEFESGYIIREEMEQHAAGGMGLGKTEYKILHRLESADDGSRFYQVELEDGGNHLYASSAIEGMYEVVSISESRGWSE
jgi:hypothetical protein